MAEFDPAGPVTGTWAPPASIDEARARARERFKSRLQAGENIGACGCGDDAEVLGAADDSPAECVIGVRFRDSGRVYYFRDAPDGVQSGDWVVVTTGRGEEAGQVVIAQHQVRRALLQGEPGRVVRQLDERDIDRMFAQRSRGAEAVRALGERMRARRISAKPIAADFAFDGASVILSYSTPDRERAPDAGAMRDLARDLASELQCKVELRHVGPRDEARLLGGLGRCGRTLCCSSWLPVFPEISMSMAKNQDLPLNPSKVSGVCGRLLCCLSYENEQYRQMKAIMPKLGQAIETPSGAGTVISLQLLKELVTVRLDDETTELTFRCDELGLGDRRTNVRPQVQGEAVDSGSVAQVASEHGERSAEADNAPTGSRRRRRRRGRRGSTSAE